MTNRSNWKNSPTIAFFFFHLNVGIRIALRIIAPVFGISFAMFYLFRVDFFVLLIQTVFLDSHFLISGLFFSIIALSMAGVVSPRVTLGLSGWIRHLPVSSCTSRRLAAVSVFIAQIPILGVIALLSLSFSLNLDMNPLVYLLGLPLLGIASSLYVLPVQRKVFTRPLALTACICSASGSWPFVAASGILIVICDLISGPLTPAKKRPGFRLSARGIWIYFIIAWRAIRLRWIQSYLVSLAILGLTWLFLLNNNLELLLATKVVRFGGALSLAATCALLANWLAVRRPAWPWSRSLPWSSRHRIILDFSFLGIHALFLFFPIAMLDMKAIFPLFFSLPLTLIYSTAVIRLASAYRMGAYGRIMSFGFLQALLLCFYPLISVLFLALIPPVTFYAIHNERVLKVSRWMERHHLAAGDSLSWSKQ